MQAQHDSTETSIRYQSLPKFLQHISLLRRSLPNRRRKKQRRVSLCQLHVGELSVEVSSPHVQGNVRLVGRHLVSGSMNGQEAKLRVFPLGRVARRLLVVSVSLPRQARNGVTKVPDPCLRA